MSKTIHRIIIALVSLAISGCFSNREYYDFTNLHSYSLELESNFLKQEDLNPPYAALFDTQGSQLLYIAADHTIDHKSKTFQLIDKAFKEYGPDFVIIEDIEESRGVSPQEITSYIENTCLAQSICSEGLYAAHLATKNKLNFIGGEPSEQEIYKMLTSQNYTKKDFLFFYFVMQLPQYYREGKFKSKYDLSTLLSLWLQEWEATEFTYLDFKNWYEKELKLRISYKDLIDPNNPAPINNGTNLQQFSSKISIIRDKYIISVILKNLTKHKKVLVIYGHSHFPTQKDVLSKYLGNPKFIKEAIGIRLKG
jgi:hypothetical protein